MDKKSWVKNAAKSTAFSSRNILKSIAPNISSTSSNIYDAGKDMRNYLSNAKTIISQQSSAIDKSSISRKAKEIMKEAMNDIKTGNFSIDKINNGSLDYQSFDLDYDLDNLDSEIEAGIEPIEEDSPKNRAIIKNNIHIDNTATLNGMKIMTDTIANTNIRATRAANMQTINAMNIGFGKTNYELLRVNRNLENINAKMDALIEFNNKNVSIVNQSMLEYFDKSLESMRTLNEMNKLTKESRKYQNISSIFDGGFNLDDYKKNVKNNFENSPLGLVSALFPMVGLIGDMVKMSGGGRTNLAKYGFEFLLKQAIPKDTRKSIEKLDQNFNRYMKNAFLKLGDYAQDNAGTVTGMLAEIFGINPTKINKDINLGDFKKGAMSWNGISQKTLVEVIPSYLANIDKNIEKLAGNKQAESRFYDAQSGKMKSVSDIKQSIDEQMMSNSVTGFSESARSISDAIGANGGMDERQSRRVQTQINALVKRRLVSNRNTDPNFARDLRRIFGKRVTPEQLRDIVFKLEDDIARERERRYNYSQNLIEDPNEIATRALISNGIINSRDIQNQKVDIFSADYDRRTGKKISEMSEDERLRYISQNKFTSKIEDTSKDIKDKGLYETLRRFAMQKFGVELPEIEKRDSLRSRIGAKSSSIINSVDEALFNNDYIGWGNDTPYIAKRGGAVRSASRYGSAASGRKDKFTVTAEEFIANVDQASLKHVLKQKPEVIERDAAKAAILMTADNAKNDQRRANIRSTKGTRSRRTRRAHQGNKMMVTSDDDAAAPSAGIEPIEEKIDEVKESIVDGQVTQTKQNYTLFQSFFKPITNALFGENGLIKKFFVNDLTKAMAAKVSKFLFGTKNENRQYEDGIMSGVANKFLDATDYIKYVFSGKGYTTRDGKKSYADRDEDESVLGSIKKTARSAYEYTMQYIFGEDYKNNDTFKKVFGWIGRKKETEENTESEATIKPVGESSKDIITTATAKAAGQIETAGESIKETIVGKENVDESPESISNKFKDKFNKTVPKAIAAGILGAGAVALSGGSMGLLGLFLPTSLIGGALVGMGASIVSGSESFKKFMFGEKDETGERNGGALSKKMQASLKKALPLAVGGAVIGGLKSIVLPNAGGFLLGTLLPGGILGGALLGMATSLITKNEAFQKYVFGTEGEDGKKQGGLLSNAHNKAAGILAKSTEYIKGGLKGLGIGALTAGVVSHMGVLGAALTPAGIVGGALVGLGLGIASQNSKFQKWFFGEEDEYGNKDGVLPRFQNFLKLQVFEPIGDSIKSTAEELGHWTREKIMYPFQLAFGPILDALGSVKMSIEDVIHDAFDKISDGVLSLTKATLDPIKNIIFDKLLKPIGKAALNTATAGVKITGSLAAAPLNMLAMIMAPQRARVMKDFRSDYRQSKLQALEQQWEAEGTGAIGRVIGSLGALASPWIDKTFDKEGYAAAGEQFFNNHTYTKKVYNKETRSWEEKDVKVNSLGWGTALTGKGLRDKNWKARQKEMTKEKKINDLRRKYAKQDNHIRRPLTDKERNERVKAFARLGVQLTPDQVTDFIYNRDKFNIGTGAVIEDVKARNVRNKFMEEDEGQEKELDGATVEARRNEILANDKSVRSDMLKTSTDINDYIYRNSEWKERKNTSATIAGREIQEAKKKDAEYKKNVQVGIGTASDLLVDLYNTSSEGFAALVRILSGGKISPKFDRKEHLGNEITPLLDNDNELSTLLGETDDALKINIKQSDADAAHVSASEFGNSVKSALLTVSEKKEDADKKEAKLLEEESETAEARSSAKGGTSLLSKSLDKITDITSTSKNTISGLLSGIFNFGKTLLSNPILAGITIIGGTLLAGTMAKIVPAIGNVVKEYAPKIVTGALDIIKNIAFSIKDTAVGLFKQAAGIVDDKVGSRTVIDPETGEKKLVVNDQLFGDVGSLAVRGGINTLRVGVGLAKGSASAIMTAGKVATAPARIIGKGVSTVGKAMLGKPITTANSTATIGGAAATAVKKLVKTVGDAICNFILKNEKIANSKIGTKIFDFFSDIGNKAVASPKILSNVSGKAMNFLKGLNIAYTAYAAISGLLDVSEAAVLFQVNTDRVDWLMRLIASSFKVIRSSALGAAFDIVLEIAESIMGNGIDIQSNLATTLYELIASAIDWGNTEELKLAQEDFEKEYKNYIAATGNESLSKNAYVDMKNETWFQKIKNFILGKDKEDLSKYEVNSSVGNGSSNTITAKFDIPSTNATSGYGAVGYAEPINPKNVPILNTNVSPATEAARAFNSALTTFSRSGNTLLTGMGSILAGILGANIGSSAVSTMLNSIGTIIFTSKRQSYGGNTGYGTYSQYDPRWKNYRIGTMPDGTPSTMATGGCGPTALATAASIMGNTVSPIQVAQMAKNDNYIVQGGSSSDLFESGASKLGLRSSKISKGSIISNLKSGKPVVLSGKSNDSGPYSTIGHIITATGIDKSNNIIINDPRKTYAEKYPISKLSSGLTNAWVYTKETKATGYGINNLAFWLGWGGNVNKLTITDTIASRMLKTPDRASEMIDLLRPVNANGSNADNVLSDKQVLDLYTIFVNKQGKTFWRTQVTASVYDALVKRVGYIAENSKYTTYREKAVSLLGKDTFASSKYYEGALKNEKNNIFNKAFAANNGNNDFARAVLNGQIKQDKETGDIKVTDLAKKASQAKTTTTTASAKTPEVTVNTTPTDDDTNSQFTLGSWTETILKVLGQLASVGSNAIDARLTNTPYKSIFAGSGESAGYGGSIENNSVYYNQGDPDWKNVNIGGGTIGEIGCLLSTISMAASNASNKALTPSLVATKYGNFDANGNMYVDRTINNIQKDTGIGVSWLNDINAIRNGIAAGYPIVLYGNRGTGKVYGKGSGTHSVLGVGVTNSGKLIFNDPGDKSRNTDRSFDITRNSLDMNYNKFKAILFKKPDGTAPGTPTNISFANVDGVDSGSDSSWSSILNSSIGKMLNVVNAGINSALKGTDYRTELALLNASSNGDGSSIGQLTMTTQYPDLKGDSIEEKVYNFLIAQGYTASAAAGIMGNIKQESGFRTGAIGDGGTSMGICQWHDTSPGRGRMTNMKNYAAAMGKSSTDLGAQLAFLMNELKSYKELTPSASANYSASEMAEKFCVQFERPNMNHANLSGRQSYANGYYNAFANKVSGFGDIFFKGKGSANNEALVKEISKFSRINKPTNLNINKFNTGMGSSNKYIDDPSNRPITKSDLINKLEVALKTDGVEKKLDVIIEYMADSIKNAKESKSITYGDINIGRGSSSANTPVIVNSNNDQVAQPTSLRMLHDLISKGYRV